MAGPIQTWSWTRETGVVERLEERVLVRDVVRIVFFVPHDNFHIASGVSHALDSYLRAVKGRPSALSHYTCCYWEPDKLCDRGWELIRETLNPKEHRFAEDYTPEEAFHLKDGADPYFSIHGEQDSGYYFGYHARIPSREPPHDSVSVIRATLPTEYLEERGPGFVRELALDMASRLSFASGHAGLALNYTESLFDQLDRLRPVIFRHPGFDLRDATIHDNLGTRVDGVHWMNFLGPPVLGQLGGAVALRARLLSFPTCTVRELPGERVLVTLGPCPEAGDLTKGQTLPAYRELARMLEPWQEPFPWGFLGRQNRTLDEQELRRWWRRFLD
jgi:hypothetical protein